MATTSFRRALSYFSTYLVLVKDFVGYLGLKAIPLFAGVVAAGLLYPLPFAMMAAAVYAMMAGHDVSAITIGRWKAEIAVDSAFLYALVLAGATLTFNYLVTRATITATTAWQTSLVWRAVNRLPVMARWDTVTAIPMPLRAERVGSFLMSLVRSGFLVGRIVGIGLPNFVMALGALIILTWLDPISVVVLIVVALLCLPLYAWALLGMISVREQNSKHRPQEQALLKLVLQGIAAKPGAQIDTTELAPEDASRFASGYSVVNAQLQSLNLVSLIVGLHVFASIAIIYALNGANLSTFVRDKIVFLVVLLFLMRSVLGLVVLLSRLSRAYNMVATLRAYLHPRRKRVFHSGNAPDNTVFALEDERSGDRCFFSAGQPTFVVMPNAGHAFELMPLSNALEIIRMPAEEVLRNIVFLNLPGLELLSQGSTRVERPSLIEISDEKQSLKLPLRYHDFGHEELGVLAISHSAWEHLVESDEVDDFCRDRIVFVVISDPQRPTLSSRKNLLVVSDCVNILGVGEFDKTWERFVDDAFARAKSKGPKVDLEEEEV
jgi:hypothetical protein